MPHNARRPPDPSASSQAVAGLREQPAAGFAAQLDEALLQLGSEDRELIILRFFGQRSLRDVSITLGVSEEVAQQQIAHALARLAEALKSRQATSDGISPLSLAALTAILSESTQGAPEELLPKISAGLRGLDLLNRAAAPTWRTRLGWLALATLVIAVPAVWQWHRNDLLRRELAMLREKVQAPPPLQPILMGEPAEEMPALTPRTKATNQHLLSLLGSIWALESREGAQSRLELLREKVGLSDSQFLQVSNILLQAQRNRQDMVDAFTDGDVQFDRIMTFLQADSRAHAEVRQLLPPPQQKRFDEWRAQETLSRAENLARWRFADLRVLMHLTTDQEAAVRDAMVQNHLAYGSDHLAAVKDFSSLLAWLERKQTDEVRRLRSALTPGQLELYLNHAASYRASTLLFAR